MANISVGDDNWLRVAQRMRPGLSGRAYRDWVRKHYAASAEEAMRL